MLTPQRVALLVVCMSEDRRGEQEIIIVASEVEKPNLLLKRECSQTLKEVRRKIRPENVKYVEKQEWTHFIECIYNCWVRTTQFNHTNIQPCVILL